LELIFSLKVFQIIYFIPYEKNTLFFKGRTKEVVGKKDRIGPGIEVIT